MYYLFIAIKIYSGEIRSLLPAKLKLTNPFSNTRLELQEDDEETGYNKNTEPELTSSQSDESHLLQDTEYVFQQVEELTIRLKETIMQASEKKYVRQEFIFSLKVLIKNYHFLNGTPFPKTINHLIASECEKYGLIPLSDDEHMNLWMEKM